MLTMVSLLVMVGSRFKTVVFLDFHVHEDLDAALDVVNQSETIYCLHLLLLLFKLLLCIVVDLLIRPDLHREVQFQ